MADTADASTSAAITADASTSAAITADSTTADRRQPMTGSRWGRHQVRAVLLSSLIVLSMFTGIPFASGVASAQSGDTVPSVEASTGSVEYNADSGNATVVDPDLNLTDPGGATTIDGARAAITDRFASGDVLDYNETTAGDVGVTGSYDSSAGVLSLTGDATVSEYESVLRTVSFDNTKLDPDTEDRTVEFRLGANYSAETGHYYEYVEDSQTAFSEAREAANDSTYLGQQGYLVTIRSSAEDRVVYNLWEGDKNVWFGASDAVTEGEWHWVTGPEGEQDPNELLGVQFWSGGTDGSSVDDEFSNWALGDGQPNDFEDQDYAGFFSYETRSWQDFDKEGTDDPDIDGYVVEYGGLSTDPALNLSATRTVTINSTYSLPVSEEFKAATDGIEDWRTDGDAVTGVAVDGETSLRLTDTSNNQAGTALYQRPFSSGLGITAEFSYYADGGNGADGITFFLLNGSQVDPTTFRTGASGGSLGYSGDPGISAGYLGVGFDEYGNFANRNENHEGGASGTQSQTVTLRGAGDRAGSGDSPWYPHLDTKSPATGNIDGGWRDVILTIDPTAGTDDEIGVELRMSWDDGQTWETVVDTTYSSSTDIESGLPEEFYMGFSGSTGGSTNTHAVSDVDVRVPANLDTTVTSQPTESVDRLDYVEYEYTVTNTGPNNASGVRLDNALPIGATGLTGVEWSYETTDGDTDAGGSIDLDSATVDLDTGETATVTVNGTVGREAVGNLDHAVGASNTGLYSDPDPVSSTATVSIDIVGQPTDLRVDDGDAAFVETQGAVTVSPTLNITDGGQSLDGATVTIVEGYDPATDVLDYDSTVADNRGISGTVSGSQITFTDATGDPGPTDYQAVLRTVTYENTETDPLDSQRKVAFSLTESADEVLYNPATGRYYEHVDNASITWADARDTASSRDHFGMEGYLATITAAAENEFLREEFDSGGWIGASDAAEESTWRWVTGPEGLADGGEGQHFFTQTAGHVAGFGPYAGGKRGKVGGGNPVGDAYANWDPRHEPNNKFPQFGGQHYGYLCEGPGSCPDGMWKDASANSPPFDADGFVVEYGGLPSDPIASPADDRTVTITPNTPPTADAGNDIESEVDAEIEFDASNSADETGIADYKWAFGDGTVYDFDATNATVTYSYDTDGEYTLVLTARDTTGQTATDEVGVTIEGPAILIANAGANETVGEGETVTFDAGDSEASEGIASYTWTFGDGSSDTGATASHSYSTPGTYEATLTLTDTEGTEATATKYVTVQDATPPTADAGTDQTVDQGQSVTLDGSGTTDSASTIESYEWDTTGNGGINVTGESPSVTYDEAGNYTVTLYATDAAGNTGTDTLNVTVTDTTDPVAEAGPDISATVGEAISFDGTNSTDNVGLDGFSWNFGDGNTTTGPLVTHNYSSAGSYTVTLAATDFEANSHTDTLTVEVTDPPEINATGGETAFRQYSGAVVVDDAIEIDDTGYFDGTQVSIDAGFDADTDVLDVTAVPTGSGITHSYDADTGVLSLSGNASAADYQSALRNVTYNNTAADPDETDRTITFALGEDSLYNPATGHYYEFVDDSRIEWFDAREAAADRDHFGLQGYLATVRSAEENSFIADKLNGKGWIGASDRGTESEWHWVTGPEGENASDDLRGTPFFNQTSSINGEPQSVYSGATNGGGDVFDGEYNNWGGAEPNHWYGGEDFAHYFANGEWNDYEYDNGNIDGYVVEYGGFSDDPNVQLSDTKTVTVSADEPPVVEAFGSEETTVGIDEDLNFTAVNATDDYGIYGYGWAFGDGTSYPVDPANESVSHSYTADGDYTVTLTVEDTANQTATATLNVTVVDDTFVIANPGANVTVDQFESVTLNASDSRASEGIASYEWDFTGDGAVDLTGENVTYAGYDTDGPKPVALTVTDTAGNSSITTTYVQVTDISPPEAVADANVTVTDGNLTVSEGTVVEFTGNDSARNGTAITDYDWTFPQFPGDQATEQSGANVTYQFSPGDQPGPGIFPVNLTVTDDAGNTNATSLSVNVTDTTPPTADAGTDIVVERGEEFSFDASESSDNAAIDGYEWTLPGGATLTGTAPNQTFDRIGNYNVSLAVNDTSGYEATDYVLVLVEDTTEPAIQELSLANPSGQEVEVTVSTDEPLADLEVDLSGPESTTLTNADFTALDGDGVYTYTATYEGSSNGDYEATLTTAADDAGNDGAGDETRSITISAPPEIEESDVSLTNPDDRRLDIGVDSDQSLAVLDMTLTRDGTPVTTFNASDFTETLDGGVYTYAANYTATEDGTFEVVIDSAENDNGDDGASGQSASATLDRDLEAEITASSGLVTLDSDVAFDAGRSDYPGGTTPSYEWSVGPNLESTSENFTHTFESPGEYVVELSVTAGEAVSTDSVIITVEDRTPPVISLSANDTTPAVGDTVAFDATGTTDNDSVESYDWSITGNGTVADTGDGIYNFTYESPGTFDESVTVSDPSGNEDTKSVSIAVQGPNATSDTGAVGFGTVTINSTNATAVLITNDGTTPLHITGSSVGDDAFALVGDAASSLPIIEPGSTRPIGVGFSPTAATTNATTLTLTHNATHQSDLTVSLSGTGVESNVSAVNSTYGFGAVSVGDSTNRTVTLWNNGSAAVDIDAISITGPSADAFELTDSGGLPGSLGSDTNTDIGIDFEPTESGEQTATLRIEAADGTVTLVALTGSGTGPEIGLPDGDLDFGEVGTGANASKTVTVANYGSQPLSIDSATVTGANESLFNVTSTPATVAPGDTDSVTIDFAPETAGNYTAILDIESNDTAAGTVRLGLNGTGVAPSIDADPRNIDFGNVTVGQTVAANITVTNLHSSLSNLSVDSTQLVGNDRDDFAVAAGSDAPFSLEPGTERDIQVTFTPSAPAGETKEAQLQILSNAGNEPQIDVWLSNTKTYVVVQEVDADMERDDPEVNLDAKNVVSGTRFDINVSKPGTRATAMGMDVVSMTTDYEGDFSMNFTHQTTPVNHTLDVAGSDTAQYVQQSYTIDSGEFEDTAFEYRVRTDSLPAGADRDDVQFYRYNTDQDQWVSHDSTFVRESGSHYRYSVETPGFSEFAVTVPDSGGGGSGPGSSSPSSGGGQTPVGQLEEPTETEAGPTDAGGSSGSGSGGSDGTTTGDTGQTASSTPTQLFGITVTPSLIVGAGGFSALAGALGYLLLLGRQRSRRFRIAIGSDNESWSRLAAAVAITECEARGLTDTVDPVAIEGTGESSPQAVLLGRREQSLLAATDSDAVEVVAPSAITVSDLVVWGGEPPAALAYELDDDTEIVAWPTPDIEELTADEADAVVDELRHRIGGLLEDAE